MATDTHSEYVILLAFPRQEWLRKRSFNVTFPRLLISDVTHKVNSCLRCGPSLCRTGFYVLRLESKLIDTRSTKINW